MVKEGICQSPVLTQVQRGQELLLCYLWCQHGEGGGLPDPGTAQDGVRRDTRPSSPRLPAEAQPPEYALKHPQKE